MKLQPLPITLREANDFVEQYHRHSKRTQRDGGKFAIGATTGDQMVGVAIVGRPLARLLDDGYTSEVTRCCVLENSPKGTGSFLYGRCWRIWQQMGGKKMITYTLQTESGSTLKGAGWKIIGETSKGNWSREGRERDWQPIYGQLKFRWGIESK